MRTLLSPTSSYAGLLQFVKVELLTLVVLLMEVSLLPLQVSLSPSLCRLDFLPQTFHVALLLLHAASRSRLLAGGGTGTRLPLELRFFSTLKGHRNPE